MQVRWQAMLKSFIIAKVKEETRAKRRKSIHDLTLADFSHQYLNRIRSSVPSLHHHQKQHYPQIPSHSTLMLNQSGPTQILSGLQSHHQAASSVHHYVLPLNQSSPMMNQIRSSMPSLHHHQQHYPQIPSHSTLMLNQSGPTQILSGLQSHHQAASPVHRYVLPLNQSSQMMNQVGPQIPSSGLQLHEPCLNQVHSSHPHMMPHSHLMILRPPPPPPPSVRTPESEEAKSEEATLDKEESKDQEEN